MVTKNGAKLRKLADAMTKEVERMTTPPDWTRTNHTHKRGEEATARLKEGRFKRECSLHCIGWQICGMSAGYRPNWPTC